MKVEDGACFMLPEETSFQRQTTMWYKTTFEIATRGKGLYPFTQKIDTQIQNWCVDEGMCYLFIQHTSASLVISESYDPSAKIDLEAFMDKLVPERQPWYRHTLEGPDDSPSHIRAMLTQPSITVPIDNGRLNLGTWQGIYIFEHRTRAHHRRVLIRCLKIG
jgi:secondary thiamine-phosphate synthase enzyme